MTTEIICKRLSTTSLFKLVLVGFSASVAPLIVACGVLGLFGIETIRVNNKALIGVEGLLWALAAAPLTALMLSVLAWLFMCAGLSIYSKFAALPITFEPER